tara:strand:+ start:1872 stop:2003 length:132 start_codon:yes stop_codon:yes gene_type:complete
LNLKILSVGKIKNNNLDEMVKMFLLEQIYRAISILENRKYHKG